MNNEQMLEHYISLAERRFGKRCKGWEIKQVVDDRDNYPETIFNHETGRVTVHLTKSTRQNLQQSKYQIAHESIHCLFACGRRDTIYFEEGLASFFALNLKELSPQYRNQSRFLLRSPLKEPYESFLALSPTDEKIRKLRLVSPDGDNITAKQVQDIFSVSEAVALAACQRMPFERPEKM